MSILHCGDNICIISHDLFVQKIYCKTNHESHIVSLSFKKKLFNIYHPFSRDLQVKTHKNISECCNKPNCRKRKKSIVTEESAIDEVEMIRTKFFQLLNDECIKKMYFDVCADTDNSLNNPEARNASKRFFEEINKDTVVFNGKNDNEFAITVVISDKKYVIPSVSQFYNCSVLSLEKKLPGDVKFDFILLDPPWWNKYIRRKRKRNPADGYKMMYNSEISSIPLKKLISSDGLVAVWCTNSQSHLNAVMNFIFPSWGINYVSSWYWMKVTKKGEPVCEFSEPPGKQPFERIIFGCHPERRKSLNLPSDGKIIVSVPSAIHSHKPPLHDLIADYISDDSQCLELFARYLLPGWTSCGDQVLSLQNLNLYCIEDNLSET